MSDPCEHIGFEANADIARLTDIDGGPVTGYAVSLRVRCIMCDEEFVFVGTDAGVSPAHPTSNVLGTELRAPIRPASAPPGWGEDAPGFAVRMLPEGRRFPAEPGVDLSDPGDHGLLN